MATESTVTMFDEAFRKVADGAEVVLDLSPVARVTTGSIEALERLAGAAETRGVKVTLSGVNVDVYRALKIARLAPRFSFVN